MDEINKIKEELQYQMEKMITKPSPIESTREMLAGVAGVHTSEVIEFSWSLKKNTLEFKVSPKIDKLYMDFTLDV